jgi:hypothetical protein
MQNIFYLWDLLYPSRLGFRKNPRRQLQPSDLHPTLRFYSSCICTPAFITGPKIPITTLLSLNGPAKNKPVNQVNLYALVSVHKETKRVHNQTQNIYIVLNGSKKPSKLP